MNSVNLIEFVSEKPEELPESSLIQFQQKNPLVDYWIPREEDILFKSVNKAIILPVSKMYNITGNDELDYFMLSPKRGYNKPDARNHLCLYMNYFEKFYDTDHELLNILFRIKYLIDYDKSYSPQLFIGHLKRYLFYNPSILNKVFLMNEHNYSVFLRPKGKSIASLQYHTRHGKILMIMSLFMNMCIPLITHFIHINKIDAVDDFILSVFDEIIDLSKDVDIGSKLFETVSTEVNKNYNHHILLWKMQDIRGKNITTHSMNCIENIVLNIMPKYCYSKNIISLNFESIKRSNGFKITDIKYEYVFTTFSSSRRDEDFNSDFDKFESNLIREDESLYLQNKFASEYTMNYIRNKYQFPQQTIEFYRTELQKNFSPVITKFQKKLIFNLFYKYFGDPNSADSINQDDYLTLMLAGKEMLLGCRMILLPYIMSGRIVRMPNKKNINNKEFNKIQQSSLWKLVQEKYKSVKIESDILAEIACILVSEIRFITPEIPEINGKPIDIVSDILIDEYLLYVLLV